MTPRLNSHIKTGVFCMFVVVSITTAFYQIFEVNVFKAQRSVTEDKVSANRDFPVYTLDNKTSTLKLVTSQAEDPYLIPSDEILQKLSESDLLRIYWKYINTIQTLCKTQTRIGVLGDGGKEMCVDRHFLPSAPCIVYSFGSNFQFDFDLTMHTYYGCEVFTYDPSMDIRGKTLPKQIKFQLRGIAGKDFINDKKWKMSTLATMLKDNDHLNKTIDVIKMDVEGAEWDAIPPFIESGLHRRVKQILIEVHAGRANTNRVLWGEAAVTNQLRALRMLYESGFRIFMRERNLGTPKNLLVPPSVQITTVNEISLLNMRYY